MPDSNSSLAAFSPRIRANSATPNTGYTPTLTSGCPKVAWSEAMAMSQQATSSQPPPSAMRRTAAMVGLGEWRSPKQSSLKMPSMWSIFSGVWSATSTPAEKALTPAAPTTMTLTSRSDSSSRRPATASSMAAMVSTLYDPLAMVRRPTPPSRPTSTN